MKILFVTEKYVCGPQFGMTNNMWNLIGSFECSGLGTYEHLFIDPEHLWTDQDIDRELLSRDYDIAVISPFDGRNATLETAKKLRNKIVMLWWDSITTPRGCNVGATYRWWEYSPYCPQLMFDSGFGEEHPNCFCVEVPQDTRIFNKENCTEEYDVGFAGCMRSERIDYINLLKSHGFNVVAAGGRGPGHANLSQKEYVSIIKKSKICLNMCIGHQRPQRKGRTFEIAACSKFMLQDYPETLTGKYGTFFEKNVEFVDFNMTDLVEKVKFYLENNSLRHEIADRMYQKYINYSPSSFWTKVFLICKLDNKS